MMVIVVMKGFFPPPVLENFGAAFFLCIDPMDDRGSPCRGIFGMMILVEDAISVSISKCWFIN